MDAPNFGPRRQDWFDTYHLPEGGRLEIYLKVEGPSTYWTLSNGERRVTATNHNARLLGQELTSPSVMGLFSPEQTTYYLAIVLPMIDQRLHDIYMRIQREKFTLKHWPLATRKKGAMPR